MKKVMFITAQDAHLGFGLAGIGQHVAEPHELEEVLQKTMSDVDQGLIIIDERLTGGIDEDRLREIEKAWPGIVVVLPSPVATAAEVDDYATRLIRRAIGYHVRIRL